jgi:hypothetical protein
MKIRTYTHPVRRALEAVGAACDRHQWIPMAVALVLLLLVNSTLFD